VRLRRFVRVDLEFIVRKVCDPNTAPEEARRFSVNQIIAAADSWLAPHEYDANERDELAPLEHAEPGRWRGGDVVTFGFDGSRTDDSSALVAVRVNDAACSSSASGRSPSAPLAQLGGRQGHRSRYRRSSPGGPARYGLWTTRPTAAYGSCPSRPWRR
jgi:hypothetical protein